MKLDWKGTTYLLEFERSSKDRPIHAQGRRKLSGDDSPVRKAVQTTARLLKVTGPEKDDREVFREYTVGHYFRDRFSLEGGRKAALAMAMYDAPIQRSCGTGVALVGHRLSKEFRTAVWQCYHSR